jgi:hypothetical protein
MALKLLSLEEAARFVGVPVEELNQLRERRQISGYRDGASWKFKEQDLTRLKQRLAEPDEESSEEFDFALQDSEELIDLPSDMVEEDARSDDIVLLSDLELGESGPGTSSTIIGQAGVQSPAESDIQIVTDDDSFPLSSGDSAAPATVKASDSGSNVRLVVDDQFDVSSEADTQLRIQRQPPSGPGSGLDLASPGIAASAGTSDIALADDSLSDELVLGEPTGSSSGSRGSKTGDSGIALEVQQLEDDELVIGGSDITLGTADSGISLASPSDSGLSLEEPLALRPAEKARLEPSLDEVSLEDSSDAGSDDDFLLTPMQDAEEEDSGSQVIALDSESSFGSDMLGDDVGMGAGMFEEDLGAAAAVDPLAATTALAGAAAPAVLPRESPYTVWNIVSLSACAVILGLTGMLMVDLMRNLWSWDTPYSINSSLADTIVGIIPGMH